MNNKISDEKVANDIKILKKFCEYEEVVVLTDNALEEVQDALQNILSELEQMLKEREKYTIRLTDEEYGRVIDIAQKDIAEQKDKRIQELEAKLLDMIQGTEIINKETPEYVKENYIPKQVIKDKIEKIIGETTPTPILKPKIEWQPWDYERVYKIQPLFELLEGEK